jgi:hypothetical protein
VLCISVRTIDRANHSAGKFAYLDLSVLDECPEGTSAARARHLIDEFFDPAANLTNHVQMEMLDSNFGAMSMFVIGGLNLTVYAFRGSFEKLDWALNGQMFMSSALHTIAFPLSLFSSSMTKRCDEWVRKIMGLALKLTSGVNLFDRYRASFREFMDANPPKTENVLYVGHSLGGGLAKFFAYQDNVPVVSVSGPGVEVLMAVFPSRVVHRSKEFVLAIQAELIPDYDAVPRVETSTGVKYRIMCDEGLVTCHYLDHTLCMLGVMCRRRHDAFCASFMNQKGKTPELWKHMIRFGEGQTEN